MGTYEGQAIIDVDPDLLDDKPWRRPGADLSDYFNYGFNEETWRAYCQKQKQLMEQIANKKVCLFDVVLAGQTSARRLITRQFHTVRSKCTTALRGAIPTTASGRRIQRLHGTQLRPTTTHGRTWRLRPRTRRLRTATRPYDVPAG